MIATIFYFVLGYGCYLSARTDSQAMQSAILAAVDAVAPHISALQTANRVEPQNVATKLIILFCVAAIPILTAVFTYCALFVKEVREKLIESARQKGHSRLKLFGVGLLLVVLGVFLHSVFFYTPVNISWQTRSFFSPSILSATFLLVFAALASFVYSRGFFCIGVAVIKVGVRDNRRSENVV